MKLLALSVLTVALVHGSLSAQSSVWKATKGEATVYLGGTCHLLRPGDYPLPAEFETAYKAADTLVFEADPGDLQSPEFAMQLMARARYQDGRTLESELSPQAYAALKAQCAESGFPIAILNPMKPGMAVLMLTLHELQKAGVSQEGVDSHFYAKSQADGKDVGELETAAFQLELITALGEDIEDEMVLFSLEDLEQIETYFGTLIQAWREGDLAKLEKLFVEDLSEYPELYDVMLADRNKSWLPKIEALFDSPEVELVLVGVGHMPGPDGILAGLKRRGYSIETVRP